jgi:hypothetical protein
LLILINQTFWCQNPNDDNKVNISVACDATFNHCSNLEVMTEAISQDTHSICAYEWIKSVPWHTYCLKIWYFVSILGTFPKLQKATISFIKSIRLSSHMELSSDFQEI